jgi:hypothetical protein
MLYLCHAFAETFLCLRLGSSPYALRVRIVVQYEPTLHCLLRFISLHSLFPSVSVVMDRLCGLVVRDLVCYP